MADDPNNTTVVTRVSAKRQETGEHPLMSYTAVTTHREMAQAFVNELMRVGQRIMPDHDLTMDDLVAICHLANEKAPRSLVMLEGRHLRSRISEQVSRADRYHEPFSLIVMRFVEESDRAAYDAVVDTLCERMRKTDLMFLFRSRIVLLLPHTKLDACQQLVTRVGALIDGVASPHPRIGTAALTYPSEEHPKGVMVLDWTEDQLRD